MYNFSIDSVIRKLRFDLKMKRDVFKKQSEMTKSLTEFANKNYPLPEKTPINQFQWPLLSPRHRQSFFCFQRLINFNQLISYQNRTSKLSFIKQFQNHIISRQKFPKMHKN